MNESKRSGNKISPPKKDVSISSHGANSASSSFLRKLRKRKIIETLTAFIAGGWLILDFVHWILIDHYHSPEEYLDAAFISLLGALFCALAWRWFKRGEKKPRIFKREVFIIPLIIIAALVLDVLIHLQIGGHPEKKKTVVILALCLAAGWVTLKVIQWVTISRLLRAGKSEIRTAAAQKAARFINKFLAE